MAQAQVDLIVLSRILHDWDPPRCAALLELSYSLLRPGGAVLICEMLLQHDRLGPRAALLQVGYGTWVRRAGGHQSPGRGPPRELTTRGSVTVADDFSNGGQGQWAAFRCGQSARVEHVRPYPAAEPARFAGRS